MPLTPLPLPCCRKIGLLVVLLWCSIGCAFGDAHSEPYPHENVLTLRYGGMWQQDMYLSPLLYAGMEVGISNEWWQAFRRAERWAHVGKVDATFGWATNALGMNRIYGLDIEAGWGAYYRWDFHTPKREEHAFQILLGPYLGVEFAPRTILNHVNKPYSMDAAVELQALAGLRYTFTARRTAYRLSYLLRTNLIGIDYMPDYWQSYYEITEGVMGDLRCAGLWNRRYLQHELTLDIACPRATWRIGIRHEYTEYRQQEMGGQREQVAVVVGTVFRYGVRGGTANPWL